MASLHDCTHPSHPALHRIALHCTALHRIARIAVQRCNDAITRTPMSPHTPPVAPNPLCAAPAQPSPAPPPTAADLLPCAPPPRAAAGLPSWVAPRDRAAQRPPPPAWLCQGYLGPGKVTLLTSQWKSGKTTLVALLLARLQQGGQLAGLPVARARAFVISEE